VLIPWTKTSPKCSKHMVNKCPPVAVLVLIALCLTGCEVVDSKILAGCREYFPQTEIKHPRRDILHIETHVGNVSQRFVAKTFQAMHAERGKDLALAASVGRYRWIIVGFNDFNVVWNPRDGTDFSVMDPTAFQTWARQTFGPDGLKYRQTSTPVSSSPATVTARVDSDADGPRLQRRAP
jgi:hypothetical protein